MSITSTYTRVGVADRDSRTNDSADGTAPVADSGEITGHLPNQLLVADELLAFDQFIARVLRRAHHAAEAAQAPDEARAILDVAQLFADDLAQTDLPFDRLRFIEAVTEDVA